jgi:ubiquitin carboxyl-terminal hydrolase 8
MSQGNKGLKNNGNTCYLNAVIQCLSHIDILSDNNFKQDVIKYKKNNSPLLDEWLNIQNQMWISDNNNNIDPINLINIFNKKCLSEKIYFESFEQNDASEFLERFLEFIHKELSRKININIKGTSKTHLDKLYFNNLKSQQKHFKDYSYIIEQFYSSILSLTQCPICKYKTDNHELSTILTLSLKNEFKSLYDSLDDYINLELLDDDNKLKCDNCNDYVNSRKKLIFWDVSPLLIILIKKYNRNGIISSYIEYPIELDMDKYSMNYKDKSTKYTLSGLCIQQGGLNSGHYYSICKNSLENKWNIYNDNHVEEILEKDIFNNHPYLLFYKRK